MTVCTRCDGCGFKEDVSLNYLQVVPNSHFFTNLDQLLQYAIGKGYKDLEIGIRNTIERGYKFIDNPVPTLPQEGNCANEHKK